MKPKYVFVVIEIEDILTKFEENHKEVVLKIQILKNLQIKCSNTKGQIHQIRFQKSTCWIGDFGQGRPCDCELCVSGERVCQAATRHR